MTQVFIQSIADYNAGRIVGQWVDVSNMDINDLWEAINAILKQSKEDIAEEWEIADYDGFYGLTPCQPEKIIELAKILHEHGQPYALYAQYVGEIYATEEGFEEAYCGEWDSFKDYATNLFDELYAHEIPEHLKLYIDYDFFARDLEMDYYHETDSNGKTHVFRCL